MWEQVLSDQQRKGADFDQSRENKANQPPKYRSNPYEGLSFGRINLELYSWRAKHVLNYFSPVRLFCWLPSHNKLPYHHNRLNQKLKPLIFARQEQRRNLQFLSKPKERTTIILFGQLKFAFLIQLDSFRLPAPYPVAQLGCWRYPPGGAGSGIPPFGSP